MKEFLLTSELETKNLAQKLAEYFFNLKKKNIFLNLIGNLGAGKTTFARYFIEEWLILNGESQEKKMVTSPTFSIARLYGKKSPVAHLDLYRLKNLEELEQVDFETYFYDYPVCIVEWLLNVDPEQRLKPSVFFDIEFQFINEKSRRVCFLNLNLDF